MKLIGIVGRVYLNKDDEKIFQIREELRKAFYKYDDICLTTLLPTDDIYYNDTEVGKDKIDEKKLNFILDKCDGFILPGGTYFYKIDEYVYNYAIKNDKPLIGICLGFQAMCSFDCINKTKFDMTYEIGNTSHQKPIHEYAHKVKISKNNLLYEILKQDVIDVNSVHKDAINLEFNNLIVCAKSDNNIIEGVYYPNKKFILGVQWHPEYLMDENSIKIFDSFVSKL